MFKIDAVKNNKTLLNSRLELRLLLKEDESLCLTGSLISADLKFYDKRLRL